MDVLLLLFTILKEKFIGKEDKKPWFFSDD